jgi:hypothetical protein
MRDHIDLVKHLFEGDVVSLQKHKTDKALVSYTDAIGDIFRGERDFFKQGKFLPFAQSYIDSGFDPNFCPTIELQIASSDWQIRPETKAFFQSLKTMGFKIDGPTALAKAYKARLRAELKSNPEAERYPYGPAATKTIDLRTAREIFQNRDNSPYGVYRKSRGGFRTDCDNVYDARGIGFNIVVGGQDHRRGDKYGQPHREEWHIIDSDQDMQEVAQMAALIERARIKSVK